MGGRFWIAAAVALTLLAPSWAHAGWLRGETGRFIVYSDGSERSLRSFVEQLSIFDHVLRVYHPSVTDRPVRRKLEIYLLRGPGTIRRIRPEVGHGLLGYYKATPSGIYAVSVRDDSHLVVEARQVLFHEYTHYFMLENFPAAYPAWLVEAYAEYFATADIEDRGVAVGGGNALRGYDLVNLPWARFDAILGQAHKDMKRDQGYMIYSQGWLLLHYMMSDPERRRQLDRFIRRTAAGEDTRKAFYEESNLTEAELTKILKRYMMGKTRVIGVAKPADPAADLKISSLPPSTDAFIFDTLRLQALEDPTKDKQETGGLLRSVRSEAKRWRGDRLADLTLARAEHRLGDLAAGRALIDDLRARYPNDAEIAREAAIGRMMEGLRDPAARQKAFRESRPLWARAHQLDGQDFRALYGYAQARTVEPDYPNANDLEVLLLARELAPSVDEISLQAGAILVAQGRRKEARAVLLPLLNSPHGGEGQEAARTLLNEQAPAPPAVEPMEPTPASCPAPCPAGESGAKPG
jgi:hypothetical protein